MNTQDSKDEILNVVSCTVVILTRNYYLFHGLKSLIDVLAPEFLNRSSVLFDVINVKDLSTAMTKDYLPGGKCILISDYDVRFCIDEYHNIMLDVLKKISGIIIMSEDITVHGGGAFILARKIKLEDMRRDLFGIIQLTTTGRVRPPVNILAYLNDREVKIFNLIIRGVELKHIALELNIHIKTLYAHRRKLYIKAGVNSLQQLHARIPVFSAGV
ncbi:LuxR C-terminal-related transcriptional regulator [Klebsiella sp. GG_Kp175]|uniref:LuxR C-terminal-related transcriptional regulator n=1 Tax=Klebsiella sp. GG_Kp175 TaxID=3153486 RepID=UPI0032B4B7C9